MLMTTAEQEKNLSVGRQINRETRADHASPFAGKVLGIWHEQVVAIADSLDELEEQLEAIGVDDDCVFIEASADYDTPIIIW